MIKAVKILVVGPSWVGDMVMAQSLFKDLRARFAGQGGGVPLELDVLAPAWSHALLERMPEVSQAIALPLGHGQLGLRARYQIAKSLRSKQYTHAYVLPNSWKSALIPLWAKIPKRIGWRGEMRWGLLNDCRSLDRERFPYMLQRFVALASEQTGAAPQPLEAIPAPQLQARIDQVPGTLEKFGLTTERPVLALCPGAEFGPSKQWPIMYYATMGIRLIQAGWSVWIFGSAKDSSVSDQILSEIHQWPGMDQYSVSLSGKTQLGEAIDLLSQTSAVITNDSGLMHVAAALGRPLVAVYGSTSPQFTPPLSPNAKVVRLGLECSPCFKRTCPLQHHKCMKDLFPTQVHKALTELLPSMVIP